MKQCFWLMRITGGERYGKNRNYSFIAGVIIAIVLGLATAQLGDAATWLWSLLAVLGL